MTIPFGLRLFFRSAFLLLIAALVTLALTALLEEKQRGYKNYAEGIGKTHAQIIARLRHPTGQLALINPQLFDGDLVPVRPVVLPYGALDFSDRFKAVQALETAGCGLVYPDGSSLCAATGNNPNAGAYLYLVGSFTAETLVPLLPNDFDVPSAHRLHVEITVDGKTKSWIAPFQLLRDGTSYRSSVAGVQGRLSGFDATLPFTHGTKFDPQFQAWMWQDGVPCELGKPCSQRTQYSIRIPVYSFGWPITPNWPPTASTQTTVRIQAFAPGDQLLFDSNAKGAIPSVSASEIQDLLQAGEKLIVEPTTSARYQNTLNLSAKPVSRESSQPNWIDRLVTTLPVLAVQTLQGQARNSGFTSSGEVSTALGTYRVTLVGDSRVVDAQLSQATRRMSWFLWAMLGLVGLVWLALEWLMIGRITRLTRRAAQVAESVKAETSIEDLKLDELKGKDELGSLSSSLKALLTRVKDDVRKERLRLEQEKDTWQAVGHEIISPLQSLMVLHSKSEDPSHRYVQRMQNAIKVLYGTASPADAIRAATPNLELTEIAEFLRAITANAPYAGIDQVELMIEQDSQIPCLLNVDPHWLEDVFGHLLSNAKRHRYPDTAIVISLRTDQEQAIVTLFNQGPPIEPALLSTVFEYGVSSGTHHERSQRGQGLFVVKSYLAKMGATVEIRNRNHPGPQGVEVEMKFPRQGR